jgi:hypothetical protein
VTLLLLASIATACGSGRASAPTTSPTTALSTSTTVAGTTTTTPTSTAPTSTAPATTAPGTTAPTTAPATTAAIPVAPQPSAEAAAAALVSGWATGNRAVALSVSTPSAVATLFAVPYPSGNAVFRGCSDAFPPLVCSYGPPALGSGALYQVYVSPVGADWYVSSVVIEG